MNRQRRLFQILVPLFAGIGLILVWGGITYYFDFPDIPGRFFVYGALFEEAMKLALAVYLVRKGVNPLNTALMALGFGIGEQLTHFWYPGGGVGYIAIWMHVISGIAMALLLRKAYAQASIKRHRIFMVLAFLAGLFVHALYNELLLAYYIYLTSII